MRTSELIRSFISLHNSYCGSHIVVAGDNWYSGTLIIRHSLGDENSVRLPNCRIMQYLQIVWYETHWEMKVLDYRGSTVPLSLRSLLHLQSAAPDRST